MKIIINITLALIMSLSFGISAIAEDSTELPAWLFVHTAKSAQMTSEMTLIMPVTREIFAFTDRPNRLHAYLGAHDFASMWDEGEGNTFKADPPNGVLTWVDGNDVKEAELLITDARIGSNGETIIYKVALEAGDAVKGRIETPSFFIDPYQCIWRVDTDGVPHCR